MTENRNPIIQRCEQLCRDGYSVSAITIMRAGPGRLQVNISRNNYFPLGEGGDLPRHKVTVDLANLPQGITARGFDRCPDDVMSLPGNDEQAEALIKELAEHGKAHDWARFDGETPDYPHWLTKPNKWFELK